MIKDIGSAEAYELIQKNKGNEDFVVLDIRTRMEYDSGHIQDAVLIDFYSDDFKEQLDRLDKDKTYLIYCRTASRTSAVLSLLEELGFSEVYHMIGGIIDWESEGFGVVE